MLISGFSVDLLFCFVLFVMLLLSSLYRSSHPEVLFKEGVLNFFPKFKGKHLCMNLSFTATLLKRDSDIGETLVFSYVCCEIFKSIFFTEHLPRTVPASVKKRYFVVWNITFKFNRFLCSLNFLKTLGQCFHYIGF